MDLELDLAAQKAKMLILQDEIERLKKLKTLMEEAKAKGSKEMPDWFLEQDSFQQKLDKVSIIHFLTRMVTLFSCFEKKIM